MSTSRASSRPFPLPSPSKEDSDLLRLRQLLPPVLSVAAGMADVIGFVSLKLFTAHITGNLVVIAALVVRGGPPNMSQILAVPVFILAVAAVWVIAKASNRHGPALARPLLLVQFLLLTCVLIFSVLYHPAANPRGVAAGIAALIAVSAMACQFALLRLALPVAPSTAVMTGNLTNAALSLLDTLSRGEPLMEGSKDRLHSEERLKRTMQLIVGFCAGCVAGAAAVSWLGDWAWSLPVALAGCALATVPARLSAPS